MAKKNQKPENVLEELLEIMKKEGASDLHLIHNDPVTLRIDKKMVKTNHRIKGTEIFKMLTNADALSNIQIQNFHETQSADFAYEYNGARYRGNLTKERGEYTCVIRRLSDEVFEIDKMGLPDYVKDEIQKTYGMILVTGPTGSGKTTTLTSLINWLNENFPINIATIEEPIEYVHRSNVATVTQQEVGRDTPTFADSMRSILRRDPDVILVGEMRDADTIETACTAAETGHLVFGTLHTNTAVSSIDRIVSTFPSLQQQNIRSQLAANLRMIINQRLIPKLGGGVVPAYEILHISKEMRHAIRNSDFERLEELMEKERNGRSILMEDSIKKLINKGVIDPDTVY